METRTLLELKDITGFELECHECHAKVLYPIHGESRTNIHKCPNCNTDWFVTQRSSDAPDMINAFLKHLKGVASHKDILAKIRLSISLGRS